MASWIEPRIDTPVTYVDRRAGTMTGGLRVRPVQARREVSMHHRIAALVVLVLFLAIGGPALAPAAVAPFDAKAFAEAQEAGRSIVVAVHAPW